ncbi:MAG: OmpH family outer membrane protein [Rhodospirillaceae bacterium]|nr:OmpH family outer membrane protein [Rhodospirillaceae bacterium]
MKKNIVTLGMLAVGVIAAVGAVSTAGAQEKLPAPVIGVVDTDLILRDSLASKGVRLERDRFATQYQTEVAEEEKKLRQEDQDLSGQRGVMAQDVFQQRAQQFQQKLADFQTRVRDKQERLDYSFQQSMSEIGQNLMVVAGEVAKERGINTVLARSQILIIVDPGMDITQPVLAKLNQRLASVKFQDPATLQRLDEQGNPIGGAPAAAGGAAKGAAPKPAAPAAAPKKQ